MNSNWIRWIRASITKYFYDNKGTLQFYADGENRVADDSLERLELRITGPNIQQWPGNQYLISTVVNIGIITMSNENDLYKMDRIIGDVSSKFISPIMIYKYGEEGNPVLGCMQRGDDIRVIRFGKISITSPAIMASVEAGYEIELQG